MRVLDLFTHAPDVLSPTALLLAFFGPAGYPYNVTILGAHGGEAGTYLNALIPLGDDKEKQSLRAAGNMTAAIPANPRTHRHRDYWRHLLTLTVQSRALDRHEIEEVCVGACARGAQQPRRSTATSAPSRARAVSNAPVTTAI